MEHESNFQTFGDTFLSLVSTFLSLFSLPITKNWGGEELERKGRNHDLCLHFLYLSLSLSFLRVLGDPEKERERERKRNGGEIVNPCPDLGSLFILLPFGHLKGPKGESRKGILRSGMACKLRSREGIYFKENSLCRDLNLHGCDGISFLSRVSPTRGS